MNIQHDITIALTKGRILKESLPLLAKAGIELREDLREVAMVCCLGDLVRTFFNVLSRVQEYGSFELLCQTLM